MPARNAHEGEERTCKRQRQRADDGADGGNASADEFTAAQNDARDGQQRITQRDIGIRRGGEANQCNPGQHRKEGGQRIGCGANCGDRPACALD
jgi:hypothetical protein